MESVVVKISPKTNNKEIGWNAVGFILWTSYSYLTTKSHSDFASDLGHLEFLGTRLKNSNKKSKKINVTVIVVAYSPFNVEKAIIDW